MVVKPKFIFDALVSAAIIATLNGSALAQDSRWDEFANAPFPNGFPSEQTRAQLLDELYFQRAVQVYLGALPAVNMLAIRAGSEAKWGAGY
jgi:hypothetical protein